MTEWVDFALYAVAGSSALMCLFEAARRIGAYGLRRSAVLMFILSSAACASAGGFAYQKYATLNAVVAVGQRAGPAKPAATVSTKAGAAEKAQISYARQSFKEHGTLASYTDRNGETKAFAPTLEDIKARERVVAYYSQAEFAARNSLAEALLWLIGALVAVVMGLAMSLAKPPAPPAPSDEESAAAEPPLHR